MEKLEKQKNTLKEIHNVQYVFKKTTRDIFIKNFIEK